MAYPAIEARTTHCLAVLRQARMAQDREAMVLLEGHLDHLLTQWQRTHERGPRP